MPSKTPNTPFGCTISCDPKLKVVRIYLDSFDLNRDSPSRFYGWKVEVWVSRSNTWKKLHGNTRLKLYASKWIFGIALALNRSTPIVRSSWQRLLPLSALHLKAPTKQRWPEWTTLWAD